MKMGQSLTTIHNTRNVKYIWGLMGILIGTIIVQRFGWYQSVKKQANVIQIIGIIIMVADVIMMQLQ
ncbi:hypothetical protein FQP82_03655 [Weissella cibaria]|nr:hypothetical protein [Weissella cibaria]MCT0950387.1 hypothetical protein [Weissella cibaria]MCT0954439.1 hypothetical protein [Weissella cibaria]MCU7539090.1 hypothetical protein [Weissella cibaria]TVV18816.1 hypothetical protein FQP82_03655 [Weissella cibaria]